MKAFAWRWGPLLLWMAVIFFASSSSNPYQVLPGRWQIGCAQLMKSSDLQNLLCQNDTVGQISHLAEYGLLALLAARAVSWKEPRKRLIITLLGVLLGCFLYGLSDEIHQLFVPGRTFQTADLMLDLAGSLVGALIVWVVRFRKKTSE